MGGTSPESLSAGTRSRGTHQRPRCVRTDRYRGNGNHLYVPRTTPSPGTPGPIGPDTGSVSSSSSSSGPDSGSASSSSSGPDSRVTGSSHVPDTDSSRPEGGPREVSGGVPSCSPSRGTTSRPWTVHYASAGCVIGTCKGSTWGGWSWRVWTCYSSWRVSSNTRSPFRGSGESVSAGGGTDSSSTGSRASGAPGPVHLTRGCVRTSSVSSVSYTCATTVSDGTRPSRSPGAAVRRRR